MIRNKGEDEISEKLTHALDEAGFTESEITRKRAKWLQEEYAMNSIRGWVKSYKLYVTGSRMEGLASPSVNSDNEFMISSERFHIIDSMKKWQQGIFPQLIIDNRALPPGFTKLRLVSPDEPGFVTMIDKLHLEFLKQSFVMDQSSVVLSRHFCFQPFIMKKGVKVNGPAHTTLCCCTPGIDMVFSLRCQHWPEEAKEWVTRSRSADWPSTDIIQQAENFGCHFVPKCSRNSHGTVDEWSYSFTLAERLLIHFWSNKLAKCYVILKTVKTTILKNIVNTQKSLSSYHIKNIIFWLTEIHGVDWWENHSLAQCVFICLYELQKQIQDELAPHYFIRDNNMFENLFDMADRVRLLGEFSSILQERPVSLKQYFKMVEPSKSRRKIDVVDEEQFRNEKSFFLEMLRTIQTLELVLDSNTNNMLLKEFRWFKIFTNRITTTVLMIAPILIRVYKSFIGSSVVSYILSTTISNILKYKLKRYAKRLLEDGTYSDVASGKLMLAAYYYIQREIETSAKILEDVENKLSLRTISLNDSDSCPLEENRSRVQTAAWNKISRVSRHLPENELMQFRWCEMVCSPVRFRITGLHSAPKAIVFEIYRRVRCPNVLQYLMSKGSLVATRVDAHVFTYFLLFMCYKKIGKERHMIVALDNLKWAAFRKHDLYYGRDVAVNLVGYCYLQLGNAERATQYFVRSMQVNHLINAAYIHLAIILAKTCNRNLASQQKHRSR